MFKPVPMNKLQQRLAEVRKSDHKPDSSATSIAWGQIVKVWDAKALNKGELPAVVERLSTLHAGVPLFDVFVFNFRRMVTLPLAPGQTITDNAVLLKDSLCRINYTNYDMAGGEIVLSDAHGHPHIDFNEAASTNDIGGIL